MGWSGTRAYYAEKAGKFYSFESISQRNDAVKNHGMEVVSSQDIYKYHVKYTKIPKERYEAIINNL